MSGLLEEIKAGTQYMSCAVHKQGVPIIDLKGEKLRVFGCCEDFARTVLPVAEKIILKYNLENNTNYS